MKSRENILHIDTLQRNQMNYCNKVDPKPHLAIHQASKNGSLHTLMDRTFNCTELY